MNGRTCLGIALALLLPAVLAADDWPQWRGPTRDGVWRESGIVEKFAGPEIKLRWTAPIANGYSGPTVADGRVYVTDRLTKPDQVERVHCFQWTDGKKLWTHGYPCDYAAVSYPNGPRASVTVDRGRAYSLGATGHLVCLDAASGRVHWEKDMAAEFKIEMPIWGIAAAPLVEGDFVILQIGGRKRPNGNGACIVALDRVTGEERWTALDDPACYSAPIMIEQAGRRVLVCWTGTRVAGMDAQTGSVLWEYPFKSSRWVEAIITPSVHRDRLLLSTFGDGSLMLRLGTDKLTIEKLWQRRGENDKDTDALHILMANPHQTDGYVYGVDSYGQFRCLDAATGDRIWEDLTVATQARWGTLHMVAHGEEVWMFNDRGELLITRLSPKGLEKISVARLIKPTTGQLSRRDGVTWSHPAFAYRHVFIRNDEELVCASLAADGK
ncbi:MAG: PQQ-like beta-propeller repeat protein [Planctomycetia bacterium]|nr:PQQ-like beta-propeller repeat protein [Planctomycetia bacterium]